jgi:hypothetical protein
MKRKKSRKEPRLVFSELFGEDTPYGHKVQREKKKYDRKRMKKINLE